MASCIVCNQCHMSERRSLYHVDHGRTLKERLEKVLAEDVPFNGWLCLPCQFNLQQIETYYNLLNVFKQRYKNTVKQKENMGNKSTTLTSNISVNPTTTGKDTKLKTRHARLSEVESPRQTVSINYFSRANEPLEDECGIGNAELVDMKGYISQVENTCTKTERDKPSSSETEGQKGSESRNIVKTCLLDSPDRPCISGKQQGYANRYSLVQKDGLFNCLNCDMTFEKCHALAVHIRMHDAEEKSISSVSSAHLSYGHGKQNDHFTIDESHLKQNGNFTICNEDMESKPSTTLETKSIEVLKSNACDGRLEKKTRQMKRHTKQNSLLEEDSRESGTQPCSCTVCGMLFQCQAALKAHFKMHITSGEHDQKESNDSSLDVYKWQRSQSEHLDSDLENKKITKKYKYNFPCALCCRRFARKCRLRSHMIRTHTQDWPIMCSLCRKGFITNTKLNTHMAVRHSHAKAHICDQCGKAYKSLKKLETHMRYHSEDALSCIVCGKGFDRNSSLFIHMKTHTPYTLLPCPSCEKVFNSSASLNTHTRYHIEEKRTGMKHPCWKCGKIFSKSKIKFHIMTHSGEGEHSCSICGKMFSSKGGVARHMIVHETSRPYSCDQCELSFKTCNALKVHTGTHTNEHPFQCSKCRKAFRQKKNLHRHIMVHTDGDRFSCDVCWRSFRYEHNLKDHIKTHSEAKPYPCTLCKINFRQLRTLKRHMLKHIERPDKPPRTRVIRAFKCIQKCTAT